jgi:TonB family protein
MWAGDDLKFEADDGQPETATATVPFTEAGIDVRSVKLKHGRLMIEGQRMALEFMSPDTIQRVPAKAGLYDGKMKLEIASDASGDYGKALDAIFTSDLTSLIPSLPSYWQRYAEGYFCKLTLVKKRPKEKRHKKASRDATALNATEQAPCLLTGSAASAPAPEAKGAYKHVGRSVKPPRVLKSSDPTFTPLARAERYSGNVEVYLIVERDGSVSHASIRKPLGLGLDEAAIASVEKYRFAPATQDGNPVAVDLYIDVNFQIF